MKGLISIFVTPLSLIAVVFIISEHLCSSLFDVLNKGVVNDAIYVGIYTLLSIMVMSVIVLLLLTIFKPENLIYDKNAILQNRGITPYGTETSPKNKRSGKPTTPKVTP